MSERVEGLLRGKTKPPGIPPPDAKLVDKVAVLTFDPPGHEATHWTVRAMPRPLALLHLPL